MSERSGLRANARAGLFAVGLLAVLAGCQQYANSTPATVLESDHAANYARVFKEDVPAGIELVHSVVTTYGFRIGVVTTDDWAFEILAPRSWVERQVEFFGLDELGDDPRRRAVVDRQVSPSRPWYAPRSIDDYDVWILKRTSIPYVHLLSERRAQADGRVRVFVSKH